MPIPLNFLSGLSKDVFAGWYPDSKGRKCTNFCFWLRASKSTFLLSPHQTTTLPDGSKWGCLIDVAGDEITLQFAIDHYEQFQGEQFPYLRCSHGANEVLSSTFQRIVSSVGLWWGLLLCSIFLLILQVWITRKKHRLQSKNLQELSNKSTSKHREDVDQKLAHECVIMGDSIHTRRSLMTGIIERNNSITVHDGSHQAIESLEQSNKVNALHWVVTALLIFLNIILLFIVFVCILSLLEIQHGLDLPFSLKILTPACTDMSRTCPQGLQNIDRASNDIPQKDEMIAFSYMVASDSQLDWYDGEHAFLGQQNYPAACSESDSCASCTAKFAKYTNEQMKRSFEKLIRGDVERQGPAPKALVLNGDITQYFHRSQHLKYKRIFHDIEGLQEFFPSLGNHDYDQGHATYNGDAWYQGTCNGEHGIGYIRRAFCGKVKGFEAKRRLTRYHSDSLAYSWEEGRYHFVHVHYYPTYENAALGIRSSIDWLENDLKRASKTNHTNILFIHSVRHLSNQIGEMLLANNVAVIFAGHLHRCFGRRCALLRTLNSHEVKNHLNGKKVGESTRIEKCFPASAGLCNTRASGNGLFYLNDKASDLVLPTRKLTMPPLESNRICLFSRCNVFVNETDNTAICGEYIVENALPTSDYHIDDNRSIPIVWSGSSSFETFLKVDFHPEKIVINALSATKGNEGKRYVDVFSLPNAVYPFHNKSDLDEFIIKL